MRRIALLTAAFAALLPIATANATAPVPLTAPTISGTPRVLSVLSCSTGTWDQPVTIAYAWTIDDVAVAAASAASYTIRAADVGHRLACIVTASTSEPAATAAASSPIVPTRAIQAITSLYQTTAGGTRSCGITVAKACVDSRRTNGSIRVGGVLSPGRSGAKVVVLLERLRGKTWVLSMTRTATITPVGTYSVTIPARYFSVATWRVRTRVPDTTVYEQAQSSFRFLRVSR